MRKRRTLALALIKVSDAHFAWMLGGPPPSLKLRLPPEGVDEPSIIESVRKRTVKIDPAHRFGGMIVADGEVVGLCGNKHAAKDGVIEIGYGVAPPKAVQ